SRVYDPVSGLRGAKRGASKQRRPGLRVALIGMCAWSAWFASHESFAAPPAVSPAHEGEEGRASELAATGTSLHWIFLAPRPAGERDREALEDRRAELPDRTLRRRARVRGAGAEL